MEELLAVVSFALIGYLTRWLVTSVRGDRQRHYWEGVTDGVHATEHALGYCAFAEFGGPASDCQRAREVLAEIEARRSETP